MPSGSESLDYQTGVFRYRNVNIYPQVGDKVNFLNDPDVLTVEDVIDTPQKQTNWGLIEKDMGLMLKGGNYGLVFTRIGVDEDVEFISRD